MDSQKINLGSFYTPPHLVHLVYETLAKNAKGNFADVALEPACGHGAFFSEKFPRFIGSDIDDKALAVARKKFPNVEFKKINMLSKISRSKFGISEKDKLLIVGNPPYNDTTSQVKNKIKTEPCKIDKDIKTRDLGLSFMLAFAKLEPDYIAILHPLSYLIKRTNFETLAPLMKDYELLDAIVFNSQEFSGTSKISGFPIVAAVYKKNTQGTSYEQIAKRKFGTLEGQEFSISDFDYIGKYISKYPMKNASGEFKFFTMRDINALKRSRTFIKEDTANTVYIEPQKLHYYCYVDIFKDIAPKLPYYLGNLDIPFNREHFEKLKDDFLTLSIAKHPDIFAGKVKIPEQECIDSAKKRVSNYFNKLFQNTKAIKFSESSFYELAKISEFELKDSLLPHWETKKQSIKRNLDYLNKVIQGDCLDIMPNIQSKSIDMILCDLPYGTTQNKWDSIIDLQKLWQEYMRIIKDNGVIALTSQGLFTAKLIISNEEWFKYKIVWIKSKSTNFLNAKKQPLRKHEDICIFYKQQPTYNPQMTDGEAYDKGFRKNQYTGSYGDFKPRHVKSNGYRYPNDVICYEEQNIEDFIYFKTAESEGQVYHPTQKPVELGRYLIRTFTNPGDVVLDNACGSGSFLLSALLEDRQFIGIEKNENVLLHKVQPTDYIKICNNRINEFLQSKILQYSLDLFEQSKQA